MVLLKEGAAGCGSPNSCHHSTGEASRFLQLPEPARDAGHRRSLRSLSPGDQPLARATLRRISEHGAHCGDAAAPCAGTAASLCSQAPLSPG